MKNDTSKKFCCFFTYALYCHGLFNSGLGHFLKSRVALGIIKALSSIAKLLLA